MILSDRVSGTMSVRGLMMAGALALAALPGWSPAQGPAAPPPTTPAPAGPFSPAPRKADPAADELKKLEGTWRVIVTEVPGSKIKPKTLVKFAGDKCTVIEPEMKMEIPTAVAIDPTKSPKWMDVTSVAKKGKGGEPDTKVTHRGIYEIDRDRMRAVFQNDPDAKRPTDFKAEDGGTVMYTYERVKAVPSSADAEDPAAAESPRIRGNTPPPAPVAQPYVPAPAPRPAAGLDLSALDLGERFLKAEASVKLTERNLQILKAVGNSVSRQDLDRAEVEAELAGKQLTLVKEFILGAVKQAEAAHDFATAEFRRGIKLADQGAVSLSELEATRAKLQDADARLKQMKTVAALLGK